MVEKRAEPTPNGDDPAPEHESDTETQRGPQMSAAPAADPRTTIAGRYAVDLQTPPNGAGIAVSYRGRDLRTRDPVLVKTLRLEYRGDPEMRARFRREARLLQFLSHPNVIRALSFAEERGAPWLVLESVPGRSLREAIQASAPFPLEEIVPVLSGLAAALDHLHARGLVHLDVRPDNAVITPDGDVKLIDFGIAQTSGTPQESSDGGAADEVVYLAPEQVCGEPVSAETDVYALGCIVYEMLTGRPPFVADEGLAARNTAIRARLEQAPVPPTLARGDGVLPAWVDDVVLGALERVPRQRYGSAASFAAVFHAGVEGDIDVETGRPRRRLEPARGRQVPVNEPGIAMKGSTRLASRRAEGDVSGERARRPGVIDATFAPLPSPASVPQTGQEPRSPRRLDLDRLARRLWLAVIVAALLNVVLIAALLATRGEIPGLWSRGESIGPGAIVRVAGAGLVAREAPHVDAPIVANLPDGGTVRIRGEPVTGDTGLWWPVDIETANGIVSGYVPESWVHAP